MGKIKLNILGISTPNSNNSFALILKEEDGNRRLPILIGATEAQSIAIEMEKLTTPRPMTHDLFKSLINAMDVTLTEVNIVDLQESTYYALLSFDDGEIEIDSRPSDAIAIAIRCNAPIYVEEDILDEVGIIDEEEEETNSEVKDSNYSNVRPKSEKPFSSSQFEGLDKLKNKLDKAILNEDYELAASIRDEIRKSTGNS